MRVEHCSKPVVEKPPCRHSDSLPTPFPPSRQTDFLEAEGNHSLTQHLATYCPQGLVPSGWAAAFSNLMEPCLALPQPKALHLRFSEYFTHRLRQFSEQLKHFLSTSYVRFIKSRWMRICTVAQTHCTPEFPSLLEILKLKGTNTITFYNHWRRLKGSETPCSSSVDIRPDSIPLA